MKFLGPSIYSNGLLLISRNPLKMHGEFIPFQSINVMWIGLDPDNQSDKNLAQKYLIKMKDISDKSLKEIIKDWGYEMIFLEMRDGGVRCLANRHELDETKLIEILNDLKVRYLVSEYS